MSRPTPQRFSARLTRRTWDTFRMATEPALFVTCENHTAIGNKPQQRREARLIYHSWPTKQIRRGLGAADE